MKNKKLAKDVIVIIPAFNEEKTIAKVAKDVINEGFEVVIVDDGSADRTFEEAKKTEAKVFSFIVNMGKGAAAKLGCDWAIAKGYKTLVLMDGDGQHEAKDVHRMLEAKKGVDVVFSYRKRDKHMPFIMRLGNYALTTVSSIINGIELKDTQSGFRVLSAQAYKKVRWSSNDYGIESEMIARVAKKNLRYAQVQIKTIYNDGFKGTTVFDGIKIMSRLLKWKLI